MATAGGGQDERQDDGEGRELRRRPSLLEQTRPSRLQKLADEGRKLPEPPAKKRPDPIYMYSSLVAGVGSGAMASILCAPIDLVRVRMQVWGSVLGEGGKNQQGAVALIGQIVKEIRTREGPKGFFRGLGATLLTVPAFWGVYCKFLMCYRITTAGFVVGTWLGALSGSGFRSVRCALQSALCFRLTPRSYN